MSLDKRYQPFVRSSDGIPIGVMQIRASAASVRPAGTISGTATVKAIQQVPNSTISTVVGNDGATNVDIIVPSTTLPTADVKVSTLVASGTYLSKFDGAFIVRYNGTTYDIFSPTGFKEAGIAVASVTSGYQMKTLSGVSSGVTITGTVTTPVSGTTFIVPVYSSSAMSQVQTGIVCPYSIFASDANSIGGLKSSSFNAKIDDTKVLSTGFPSVEIDRMITKTSVQIQFESQEYTNSVLGYLKSMISSAINDSASSSVALEVVMRTRGSELITFWCPTCSLESMPNINPGDDYSSFQWSFTANKMTEISSNADLSAAQLVVYNTWLDKAAKVFFESSYIH